MIDHLQKFKATHIKAREQYVKRIAQDLKTKISKMDARIPLFHWMRFIMKSINALETYIPDMLLREEEGDVQNDKYVLSDKQRAYVQERSCLRVGHEFRCRFAKASKKMNMTCDLTLGKLECLKERLLMDLRQIIQAKRTTNPQNLYMLIFVLKLAIRDLKQIGRER